MNRSQPETLHDDAATSVSAEAGRRWSPQLSVAQLMAAVTLLCILFGCYYWIGPVYATIALVPVIIAIPLWVSQPNTVLGALIGMVLMWLAAEYLIIGWEKWMWQYYACQFCVGMYAAAFGSGMHAIYLGRWFAGALVAIVSGVSFVVMLLIEGALPPV